MVTATDRPEVLRVSFITDATPKFESEIVCLVEATDAGRLRVRYKHHLSRTRPTGMGTWDPDTVLFHHILSPAVRALIRTYVMLEIFSTFCGDDVITIDTDR